MLPLGEPSLGGVSFCRNGPNGPNCSLLRAEGLGGGWDGVAWSGFGGDSGVGGMRRSGFGLVWFVWVGVQLYCTVFVFHVWKSRVG